MKSRGAVARAASGEPAVGAGVLGAKRAAREQQREGKHRECGETLHEFILRLFGFGCGFFIGAGFHERHPGTIQSRLRPLLISRLDLKECFYHGLPGSGP
jgi:hypothetical protein